MDINKLSLTILLLLAWLCGVLVTAWSSRLITIREITLVLILFTITVITVFARHSKAAALTAFLNHHTRDIMDKQLADLKEAHRKRISSLKDEFAQLSQSMQRTINRLQHDYRRLNIEYDFMIDTYQDTQRTIQELEDRIVYLEGLRSRNTATERTPFSAPASRVQFSDPPRRGPAGSRGPATPSPLSQVATADLGWT